MRKIEKEMVEAILNRKSLMKGNTTVYYNSEENVTNVRLHGNLIAKFQWKNRTLNWVGSTLTVSNCGWGTATTRSRLNAIFDRFAPEYGAIQRNYTQYLRVNDVDIEFNKPIKIKL